MTTATLAPQTILDAMSKTMAEAIKVNTPDYIRKRPQWVCWRYFKRGNSITKPPYRPDNGRNAKVDNPGTWSSFGVALKAFSSPNGNKFDGVGFVLTLSGKIIGVDLDHVIRPDGSLEPWAEDVVRSLDSYTEVSPSRTGLRILCKGYVATPGTGFRLSMPGPDGCKFELYTHGRYLTITGWTLPGYGQINPRSSEAEQLIERLKVVNTSTGHIHREETNPVPPVSPPVDIGTDDKALIEKAMGSKDGVLFTKLWNGDHSGYNSQSEADQALANKLCFWCGPDAGRIDRLFRASGLYRPEKWDRHAGQGATYGERTIALATRDVKNHYEPRSAPPRKDQSAPAQEQGTPPRKGENQSSLSFNQDPLPLPQLLPDVPSLPEAICPPSLAPWWQDIADRAQIPLEYPAAASIVILSSLVGRKITIMPKRKDDWQVVPNLWGMIVGRPSVLKSHALDTAAAPMKRMAALAKEAYEKEKNAWLVKEDLLDVEARSLKDQYKKAIKDPDGNERLRIQHELEELRQKSDAEKVVERRYWTADPTVEKLGELLRDNPQGLLIMRDELAGYLRSFNKQGRENDREYVMECWSGNGSFPQDRIGRGTVAVEGLCVSVIGTIQPGKLNKYVSGALAGEFEDDGLIQRFQVVVWPELPKDWKNEDRRPDAHARDRALEVYTKLDALDPDQVGAVYPQYGDLPYLRFNPDAQDLFDQWRTDLEARIRAPEMERTPAFESHLAKYRSLMPSLALLFHLLDCADTGRTGPVTHESAYRAVEWCTFLEAHARKVFAPELNLDAKTAHALAAKIKEGAVVDGDTLRDIYRNQWTGMTRPDEVRSAARILEACKWLVLTREGNKEVIRLNPKVKA